LDTKVDVNANMIAAGRRQPLTESKGAADITESTSLGHVG